MAGMAVDAVGMDIGALLGQVAAVAVVGVYYWR
jgi:hypothetical protein